MTKIPVYSSDLLPQVTLSMYPPPPPPSPFPYDTGMSRLLECEAVFLSYKKKLQRNLLSGKKVRAFRLGYCRLQEDLGPKKSKETNNQSIDGFLAPNGASAPTQAPPQDHNDSLKIAE